MQRRWRPTVKIPLDYVCVKSGVLCPRCQALVDSGEVDEREVDVMKLLIELEEKPEFRSLQKAEYVKTYFIDNLAIIVLNFRGQQNIPVSRIGRELSAKLNKRIRIVNKSGDLKNMALQLVYPARILGINTLWLPDGTRQHIVRIPRYDVRRLPAEPQIIEHALTLITGKPVRIRLE